MNPGVMLLRCYALAPNGELSITFSILVVVGICGRTLRKIVEIRVEAGL